MRKLFIIGSSGMPEIGENQLHKVTLTMPFDLTGQLLELHYVPMGEGTSIAGGTATGEEEGKDVSITTDLADSGIGPGSYRIECRYSDGGTERELGLDGDDSLYVHDAVSVS